MARIAQTGTGLGKRILDRRVDFARHAPGRIGGLQHQRPPERVAFELFTQHRVFVAQCYGGIYLGLRGPRDARGANHQHA